MPFLVIDLNRPLSLLGSPIHITESARINDATRFYRVASNLCLGRLRTLEKFSRFIRFGILSPGDAEKLLLGRLPRDALRKYSLFKYYVSDGFQNESEFYFNPDSLWPVQKKDPLPGNTIPFP